MRIVGSAAQFAAALSLLARTVPARTPVPVLGACRLSVAGGTVELAATDLEVSLRLRADGVTGEGTEAVLLPARFLADLFRHLEGDFDLEAVEGGAVVRCGQARFALNVLDPSSYPQIPAPQKECSARVPFDFLRRVASRVGIACSGDAARGALAGVLWEEGPEGLTLVATDATRLAYWRVAERVVEARGKIVVPGRALSLVAGLPDREEVDVVLEDTRVFFSTPSWTLCSRLIAAPFPRWETVLPRQFVASFVASRRECAAALRRAAVVAHDGTPALRVVVDRGGVAVEASSSGNGGGRGREELEAEVEGTGVTAAFDARLLLDGVEAFEGEKLRFSLAGAEAVSELSDPEDPGYRYLVLPLRQ